MSRRKYLANRKPCGRLYPTRDSSLLSGNADPLKITV